MRIIFFLIFSIQLLCSAQTRETEIRDVKTDSFPVIKGKLWVRNPGGLDTAAIQFSEGQNTVKVKFSKPEAAEPKKAKSIVFLIENHWNYPIPTKYYKDILSQAIDLGLMQDGDAFAVIGYDCQRPPYGDNQQLLFPDSLDFCFNDQELRDAVNGLKRPSQITGNQCVQDAQMYTAIYRTVELLAVRKTDNQKGVVVLAKDLSIGSDLDASGVGDFALKHGIPVYAIMYKAGYQGKFGAKVTCERSYGEYWMSPDTKNDPSQGADALMGFMNDFLNKAAGWEYDFSYTTVTPKDGAQHVVQIKTPFGPEGFTYEAPAKTLVEKLKDNLLFVIIGGILFIGIIVLLVILSRKRKKERILKDAEFKQTQQKLDEQKASADRAKMETDAKLRTIEDKEQARIRDFEEQQRKEREAIENKRLINEMLERGAFANLVYASGTESGRFELSEPVIKIGRNPTNHFHINHVSVSREHATVQFINGGYYLKDLGSSNGTFVNGRRITQEKLSDGDHIAFGEIAVTFHI